MSRKSPKNRAEAAPTNPTMRYQPRGIGIGAAQSYYYDGKPWYSYMHAPRMRRDPFVNWLLDLWQYPFQQVKFRLEGDTPEVVTFVQKSLQRFWSRYLPVILKNYCCFGFGPAGFEYTVKDGLWKLMTVTMIQPPTDAQPQKFAGTTKFAGFKLDGVGLVASPYAFWFSGYEELGLFYDRPPLAGVYDPWLECNGRGGAKDLRQLYARKHSIRPAVAYHPSGTATFVDKDGNQFEAQWADIAMGALEYVEAGSNVAVVGDRDDKGNRKFEVEWATPNADAPTVTEYPDKLKKEMAAGMGIPLEVIEAAESGSGYSGRKIPYLAWLGKADQMSGLIVESFDAALRYVVRINFGERCDYEITPLSLVEEEKKSEAGQQKQPGGGPSGGGSFPQQTGGGGDQSGGGAPQATPHAARMSDGSYRMSAAEWDESSVHRDDGGRFALSPADRAAARVRALLEPAKEEKPGRKDVCLCEIHDRLGLRVPCDYCAEKEAESAELSAASDGSQWITIGGREEGDEKHVGGFPVQISSDGTILKGGPRSLQGKKVKDVGKHFKRQRKEIDDQTELPKGWEKAKSESGSKKLHEMTLPEVVSWMNEQKQGRIAKYEEQNNRDAELLKIETRPSEIRHIKNRMKKVSEAIAEIKAKNHTLESVRDNHQMAIEDAIAEGSHVPDEVLKDYPSLKRQ